MGLRIFLGLASYYRRFIKEFAKLSAALHAATSSGNSLDWNDQMNMAFTDLKKRLREPPILACPNFYQPLIAEEDAS